MTRLHTPTPEEEAQWRDWVAALPDGTREIAERFDPWTLYRRKSSGETCIIEAFDDGPPVTMTIDLMRPSADGEHLVLGWVKGVDPEDLEACKETN